MHYYLWSGITVIFLSLSLGLLHDILVVIIHEAHRGVGILFVNVTVSEVIWRLVLVSLHVLSHCEAGAVITESRLLQALKKMVLSDLPLRTHVVLVEVAESGLKFLPLLVLNNLEIKINLVHLIYVCVSYLYLWKLYTLWAHHSVVCPNETSYDVMLLYLAQWQIVDSLC